jgi:hypothetical protein
LAFRTDDLQSVLTHIPDSDAERIDVIRSSASGSICRGDTIVADIIRKTFG